MKKLILSVSLLAILVPFAVQAQTDYSGREKVYRATHTKMTELKHTKLKVSFDYEKEQMHGEEWLTASPYFSPTDSLVLNAKAMLIHEVALDKNGSKQALKYDYKNDILKIEFKAEGVKYRLSIDMKNISEEFKAKFLREQKRHLYDTETVFVNIPAHFKKFKAITVQSFSFDFSYKYVKYHGGNIVLLDSGAIDEIINFLKK